MPRWLLRQKTAIKMIRFLSLFYKGYEYRLGGALLLAAATLFAGIGLMATSGYLISKSAQVAMIADLFVITAAVRFFGVSRAILRYFERVMAHDLTFRVLLAIRMWFYGQISEKSLAWLMGKRAGDLLARAVADIESLQNSYLRVVSPAIVAALVSITTFVLLTLLDFRIAISTLFFLSISGIAHSLVAQNISKGCGKEENLLQTRLKMLMVDRLQGLQEISWLGQKQKTLSEYNLLQNELNSVQKKNAAFSGLNDGISNLISHLGMFAALVIAAPLVLGGQLNGVMLAMIVLGVFSSFEAVQNLANAFYHNEKTLVAAGRIQDLIRHDDPKPKPKNHSCNLTRGVAFKGVGFSYNDDKITLSNINISIPEGSKTAIVGPSGSGKSTLVNLLLRFWDCNSGTICLDGIPIPEYPLETLRKTFAVVPQDHFVFNRTIRENLRIAQPLANDEEIDFALANTSLIKTEGKAAQMQLMAVSLSGGERQLLALTGALLKETDYWVFDEPTANLDTLTERRILNHIWENVDSRTLILITHRLVDLEKMDQIIVMNKGKIIERGTHNELLHAGGFYASMVELQNQMLQPL